MTDAAIQALCARLDQHSAMAVAVSGGVDSMVLAYVAHRFARARIVAVHACSPAVPQAATARVVAHAGRHGWDLQRIDAGEFADPAYRANPINRCYFCKSNLYSRIRAVTGLPIASGTNLDDLTDFRPGLKAASEQGVVHPFVEAGIGKADIYALAARMGLDDLAALPAQPCLSSRVQTGIAIAPADLQFIEAMEATLAQALPRATALRCRVTDAGVVIELEPMPAPAELVPIEARVVTLCRQAARDFVGVRHYRRGSAFLAAPVA